jgi:hypothetical protein
MKRWAWITVALYLLAFLGLTVPVVLAAFHWGPKQGSMDLAAALGLYKSGWYWLWFAVAGAGQFLLLAVPVAAAEGRPEARRPLRVSVVTAAFLLGAISAIGLTALTAGVWGDKGFELRGLLVCLLLAWAAWGYLFHRFAQEGDPEALTRRLTSWLLRGSILELLVAVPSHVIVRRRQDCCAPIFTFWGIAAGLSVMAMCFGPGVFYLFVERMKRLRSKPPTPAA